MQTCNGNELGLIIRKDPRLMMKMSVFCGKDEYLDEGYAVEIFT